MISIVDDDASVGESTKALVRALGYASPDQRLFSSKSRSGVCLTMPQRTINTDGNIRVNNANCKMSF